MDYFFGGLIVGFIVGMLAVAVGVTPASTAYAKGITDCQQGTTSYTVTVGPEGVDTTYVYKP